MWKKKGMQKYIKIAQDKKKKMNKNENTKI